MNQEEFNKYILHDLEKIYENTRPEKLLNTQLRLDHIFGVLYQLVLDVINDQLKIKNQMLCYNCRNLGPITDSKTCEKCAKK